MNHALVVKSKDSLPSPRSQRFFCLSYKFEIVRKPKTHPEWLWNEVQAGPHFPCLQMATVCWKGCASHMELVLVLCQPSSEHVS